MSSAILTFPGAAAITARKSRYEQGDTNYWRRTARQHGVITGKCTKCLGKGWVTVDDGSGGVDYDECQQCAPVSTRTDYPTADDAEVEVNF